MRRLLQKAVSLRLRRGDPDPVVDGAEQCRLWARSTDGPASGTSRATLKPRCSTHPGPVSDTPAVAPPSATPVHVPHVPRFKITLQTIRSNLPSYSDQNFEQFPRISPRALGQNDTLNDPFFFEGDQLSDCVKNGVESPRKRLDRMFMVQRCTPRGKRMRLQKESAFYDLQFSLTPE